VNCELQFLTEGTICLFVTFFPLHTRCGFFHLFVTDSFELAYPIWI